MIIANSRHRPVRGVLVLALGRATRLARFYAGRRKRYSCAVRFGFATDTYDADGEAIGDDSAPAIETVMRFPSGVHAGYHGDELGDIGK